MTYAASKELYDKHTLEEFLIEIDNVLKTEKKLKIDLRGTDLLLVKNVRCVHCMKAIPTYIPIAKYTPDAYRCAKCEDTCAHSYDAVESPTDIVASYSYASSQKVLSMPLTRLGLVPNNKLSVLDEQDIIHTVTLKYNDNIPKSDIAEITV